MRRFWDEEQTSWWVFEFCLFWGLWVPELMSKRVDEFLSFAYFGVGEFVRWWTDELISFWVCFCGGCAFCFWGGCALMSSRVFEMVGYWVDEFASWGDYKLMSSWACELTSWCLRELLSYLELAYPRVAFCSRAMYIKRSAHLVLAAQI